MRRFSKDKSKNSKTEAAAFSAAPPPARPVASNQGEASKFLESLQNPEVIERVRTTIKNAHVFKLPPRQSASIGWRGADWKEKVWQGTVKVVERGDITAVLLVDKTKGSIFAVCPVREGAVDRCVDSSRYFVLRIENANGRHMFVGVAFNERNDAFDFNTALEDSKRERELEKNPIKPFSGPTKDYSIKEGEKIHVSIPKSSGGGSRKHSSSKGKESKGFLRPSNKDTPSRVEPGAAAAEPPAVSQKAGGFLSGSAFGDSFPCSPFGGNNFFNDSTVDDQSTGSGHPFFKQSSGSGRDAFDPRNYQTESGR